MKKIFYLMAALLPALAFTACDDKDELPDVDFNVAISNASFVDNEIYVVQGDTLTIDGVEAINNEQGKGVTIPYVNYYFDGLFLGQEAIAPYGFKIDVNDNVMIGTHYLKMTCPVFAVDKEPGYAIITYKVNVIESSDDIPSSGVQAVLTNSDVIDVVSNS